jgi:hypothetical protein
MFESSRGPPFGRFESYRLRNMRKMIHELPSFRSVIPIIAAAGLFSLAGGDQASASGWENEVTVYGWLSNISGTLFEDTAYSYDVDDIVGSMEMVFMGGYEGRYDRWSFVVDAVYVDVGDESDTRLPVGLAAVEIDLSSWILSAGIGYDVVQSSSTRIAVIGGLRYLDLELDSQIALHGIQVSNSSGSQDLLDGTLGLRGYISLSNNWYLPFYADIGTGDSDVSYQLFGGIGYQFDWGDIRVGYRHLCIEMDEDKIMKDMTVSGPVFGVGFRF